MRPALWLETRKTQNDDQHKAQRRGAFWHKSSESIGSSEKTCQPDRIVLLNGGKKHASIERIL